MKRMTQLLLATAALVGLATPIIAAAAAPAPATSVRGPEQREEVVVLRGATLWIGDGSVLENGALEIRAGKIVRVGPAASFPVPQDATVLDMAGKVITPGFIAAGTALGLREIDFEVQTRDDAPEEREHPIRAAYNPVWGLNAGSAVLAVQAIEGITSAAVTPTGGLISGQVAWIDLLPGAHGELVVEPVVGVTATLGETVEGSRIATIAKVHEIFDDVQFHAAHRRDFERAQTRELAAHRLDLEALEPVLSGRQPFVVTAHRASDILAALDLARRWKLRLVILGGTQAWQVAEEIAAADVPVIVQPSRNLPESFDHLGARRDLAARLHAAGIEVGIGMLDDLHNVRNVRQEAGIAVAHGLPASVAQRALTLGLAEAYGMDDRYGSLTPGKVANIVVWNGDPFELSSFPDHVFVRGRQLPMRSRQTELRDRYMQRLGLGPAKR